jgi:hypothetical protein
VDEVQGWLHFRINNHVPVTEGEVLFLRKAQVKAVHGKKGHIQSVVLFYLIIHYIYRNYINFSLII